MYRDYLLANDLSGNANSDIEKIQLIARAELLLNLPEEKRITTWYGDYALYEPKLGINSETINNAYSEYFPIVNSFIFNQYQKHPSDNRN